MDAIPFLLGGNAPPRYSFRRALLFDASTQPSRDFIRFYDGRKATHGGGGKSGRVQRRACSSAASRACSSGGLDFKIAVRARPAGLCRAARPFFYYRVDLLQMRKLRLRRADKVPGGYVVHDATEQSARLRSQPLRLMPRQPRTAALALRIGLTKAGAG
jgi:hypothetical protein